MIKRELQQLWRIPTFVNLLMNASTPMNSDQLYCCEKLLYRRSINSMYSISIRLCLVMTQLAFCPSNILLSSLAVVAVSLSFLFFLFFLLFGGSMLLRAKLLCTDIFRNVRKFRSNCEQLWLAIFFRSRSNSGFQNSTRFNPYIFIQNTFFF